MNCQKCGHEVNEHGEGGCNHGWGPDDDAPYQCFCAISQIDAFRAAQRASAIAHLRNLGDLSRDWFVAYLKAKRAGQSGQALEMFLVARSYIFKINSSVAAYRAVGILERKP